MKNIKNIKNKNVLKYKNIQIWKWNKMEKQ